MEQRSVGVGSRVRVRDEDGEAEFEPAGDRADPFAGRSACTPRSAVRFLVGARETTSATGRRTVS